MRHLTVVLRCGEREARHRWPLDASGALSAAGVWSPSLFPGQIRVGMADAATGAGSWELTLAASEDWPEDVGVEARVALDPGETPGHVLWPRYEGLFERRPCANEQAGVFHGSGHPGQDLPADHRLALPFAVLESGGARWLGGTDPTFSTTIAITWEDSGETTVVFSWRWLAAAGVHGDESRRLFVQPVRDERAALDRWFALATPDVPAGPAWLHEIALQNYDYLSKDGQGWYADIDAACALIAPGDRDRALFCLHGWYDQIGRYCYDAATGRLDENWIAFPHIHDSELLARAVATPIVVGNPSPTNYAFRNLDRYRPVPLSWPAVRDRLRYARERGFRTAVYALTGLQAAGSRAPRVADGTGLDIDTPLWHGPDLIGPTYLRNPLHPEVRAQVLGYIAALLDQVGDLTDALVMDEAYYVAYGTLGPAACPGYADRAQLSLIREMTGLCHRYRPDLAFLTADLLGAPPLEQRVFPYSLGADGIYQDSWCTPETWDCVRFPAWRNVAWSCNWAPVSNLAFTRWAVLAHNAPVAISNGCFGDDTGLAEMEPAVVRQVADLWRVRRTRDRAGSVPIVDATTRRGLQ